MSTAVSKPSPKSRSNTPNRVKPKPRDTKPTAQLTEQQRQFVLGVAKGESLLSAAKRAGYAHAHTQAYELISKPHIANAVAREKAKFEAANEMTRKKVMDGLLESIDLAKLAAEPSAMIQGWKVIAQMCGYLAPVEHRVKVDVSGSVTMKKLVSMTDAELLEIIENQKKTEQLALVEDVTAK